MMYYCLYKKSLEFKWGTLYAEAKPHLDKKFTTEQEAAKYLATAVPEHIKHCLQVTQGCDM